MSEIVSEQSWAPTDELRQRLVADGWLQLDGAISLDALRAAERWILDSSHDSRRLLLLQTERDPRGILFGRKPVPEGPGEPGTKP